MDGMTDIKPMTNADLAAWDLDYAENESACMHMEVHDYRALRERLRLAEAVVEAAGCSIYEPMVYDMLHCYSMGIALIEKYEAYRTAMKGEGSGE